MTDGFEHIGWRFNTTLYDDRERLCNELRALCCQTLNLCASAGCACVTGVGEAVCLEQETSGNFGLLQSQGPHWNVVILRQPQSVLLAVYFEGPRIPLELRELHLKLTEYRVPMFQSTGSSRL